MTSEHLNPRDGTFRLTRRNMLFLAGGTAATGLLFASGVAQADARPLGAERMSAAVTAALAASAPPTAQVAPLARFQQAAQTSFAPINSGLTFGQPTDMAAGWDGTLWAVDEQGAPHVYEPLSDTWQLHGTGVDAAALINDAGPAVYFKGGEVYVADGNSVAQPIERLWPQLPPSYKLGVQGAAWAQPIGKLVLFRGATYLTVPWPAPGASAGTAVDHVAMQPGPDATPKPTASPSATPTTSRTPTTSGTLAATPKPAANAQSSTVGSTELRAANAAADYVPTALTSLEGWSQNGAWQDGVIEGVFGDGQGIVFLIRGGDFVILDFSSGNPPTAGGPRPLNGLVSFSAYLPADWLNSAFDGFYVAHGDYQGLFYAMNGQQALIYSGDGTPASRHYIAQVAAPWPATWNPVFQHAPTGRTNGLWAASVEGYPMSFDGTRWTQQPGDASSIGVGQDGSVFSVGQQNQQQLSQWSGSGWDPVASHSASLAQVSVGNSGQVWTRDSNNAVHQLNQGQLQPVSQVGTATHLAANSDGSLFSCNGSDSNAYRYASDLGVAPTAVSTPGTVQKVASTRFGVAHCLSAQNGTSQLYQVQSPYVFRSANSYTTAFNDSIDEGLGNLYITSVIPGLDTRRPAVYFVVALDGHTGQELSRSAIAPPDLQYTPPVFDTVHETVIVGLTSTGDIPQPGRLLGLDARNLSQVRWSITLPNNPTTGQPFSLGTGRPTLSGAQLCVTDNFNTLIMFDTGQTPGATPSSTPMWTYTFGSAPQDVHRLPPPVIANGQVYAAWWLFSESYGYTQLWLWKFDATTGVGTQTGVDASPGFRYIGDPRSVGDEWLWMGHTAPLLAVVPGAQAGQSRLVLFVNGGSSVAGVDVNANSVQYYDLPGGGSYVTSGFGLANGVLWFGDNGSNLHGVDGQTMKAVANTPAALGDGSSGTSILTTPVPYSYGQGQLAVLLGLFDEGASVPGLMAFDPTSGNVASIPTQGTTFVALSRTVSNGNIYTGGAAAVTNSGTRAQVYSLRVDTALQGLRDFVVDSQLMQDFDDPSQPTHNPNGVARYQTHLTLIDDQKAPLANHAVKLWADQANTNVLVNGQNFTIGPDDNQYAAVTTGNDGTLLILSGYTQADASDKPDLSAPPLRAWASFMNPYERMMVFRDREFHNRVSTAHATDASQSNADDPTRPNLKTAQKYGPIKQGGSNSGDPLFNAQQQSDGQPQQVATTIQKMSASVGTAPRPGSKTLKASFALHATDAPGKYVAYADTPGAQYSPVNVAANRAAVVLQTGGLSYSSNNDASIPPAYSSMTPAEATQAIDALQGQPWHTSQYATPRVKAAAAAGTLHLGGFFDDFWNWLKGAVATITHIIVAVADDIYAGIRFIVDGVEHVFQAIVAGIEQIASVIGAFFVELGHLIEEIIEALSILFQFGHIIDTHKILKQEVLQRINGITGNSNYPGFATAITSNVIQPLDGFFKQGEQAINDSFNKVADQIAGQAQAVRGLRAGDSSGIALNGLKGSGSTAHSTFTVQPSGGGAPASTTPQSAWGTQKLQSGLGSGSAGSSLTALQRATLPGATSDDLNDFFPNFLQRLTSDGDLSSEFAKLQSGANGLGSASSPGDFMRQAIAELIRGVALLLDGGLAVSNAFLDGFLGLIGDVIPTLMDPTNGLLNQPMDIPVLSWLYNLLFGEPLTVINAVTLVAAIPITLIWRIAENAWPADSLGGLTATQRLGASPALVKVMYILGGICAIIYGIISAISDASSLFKSFIQGTNALKEVMAYFYIAAALVGAAVFFPLLTNTGTPTPLSWASWGVALAIPPITLLGLPPFTVLNNLSDAQKALLPEIVSIVICALNLTLLGIGLSAYLQQTHPSVSTDLSFAAGIAATVPGIFNPLTTFGGEDGEIVVAALDLIFGLLSGALLIASALETAGATRTSAGTPRAALAAV